MTNTESLDNGWDFNDSADNESTLRPLCERVEEHFQLPALRLYRYFAAAEDSLYRLDPPLGLGKHYRGFHIPRRGAAYRLQRELINCFYHSPSDLPDDAPFEETIAFDNMIYIRRSTCDDPTGFTATYAHELQHFVQYGFTPRLWAVNNVLHHNLRRFESTAIATDIPSERDANIVSKRVAEIVCGVEAVKSFAEERIRFMEALGATDEAARWVFFRDAPSSTEYNLLEETLALVKKYKGMLDFGIDVDQPEWWLGPLED